MTLFVELLAAFVAGAASARIASRYVTRRFAARAQMRAQRMRDFAARSLIEQGWLPPAGGRYGK